MKKLLLILLALNITFVKAQNLAWYKQFYNHGISSFYNHSVSTNTLGEIANSGLINHGFVGTQFIDFDPSASTYSVPVSSGNTYNVWASKLDINGDFLWARAFNVNNDGKGQSIVKVNNQGEVILGARFLGLGDFDPSAANYTMTTNTNQTAFITKLDAAGNLAWAMQFKQLSGAARATISDIEIDNLNNIIVTGYFVGSIDFDPSAITYSVNAGTSNNSFIAKYNNAGSLLWLKTIAGGKPVSSVLDKNKNILITGIYDGTLDFNPSAATNNLTAVNFAPYGEPFILKLDSNGLYVWAKQIADGISFHNNGTPVSDIGVDNNDDVYITGATKDSLDFDPSAATYYLKSKGQEDVYAVKLNATGNFVWAKMFAGNYTDYSSSIQLDKSNNDVYIGFNFQSTNLDLDPGALTNTISAIAGPSILVNKLSTNGDYVTNYYFNSYSNNPNNIGSMVMDKNNDLIVSGDFSLANSNGSMWVDFDPGAAVVKGITFGSNSDGFIVKLNNLSTRVNEIKNDDIAFSLFPNPTKGSFHIEIKNNHQNVGIEITDVLGQIIYSENIQSSKTIVNTTNLHEGIYFVSIINGNKKSTQKIIIE